jgi:hypothetical protein
VRVRGGRRARGAMFAAINAGAGDGDTRESGETTEAQCARVTTSYERALHALHAGRAAEAQGALRARLLRACLGAFPVSRQP